MAFFCLAAPTNCRMRRHRTALLPEIPRDSWGAALRGECCPEKAIAAATHTEKQCARGGAHRQGPQSATLKQRGEERHVAADALGAGQRGCRRRACAIEHF